MTVFCVALFCCYALLIPATTSSEVPHANIVTKPRIFFSSWLDGFVSNFNRQDNFKNKYEELLKINEKLQKDYEDQLAENKRIRNEHEEELKEMGEKQREVYESLKEKFENEIREKVDRLEGENSRFKRLTKVALEATNEAIEKYNEQKNKHIELQGKFDNLSTRNKDLKDKKTALEKDVRGNKKKYEDEMENVNDSKMKFKNSLEMKEKENQKIKDEGNKAFDKISQCQMMAQKGATTDVKKLIDCLNSISSVFTMM